MQKTMLSRALACALMGVSVAAAAAEDDNQLAPVVVTAPASTNPLEVVIDPKAPQQPIPANDGASFLKNIPGFSLIRKGATDGDPVLRGSAGSRLNILLDGMEFHGGCGSRMDPPTAYVFPESYDEVTVIKGPQTVRYGNGNSAGVVLFDHDREDSKPGVSGFASVLGASFGRVDAVGTARAASDKASLAATLTHAKSDDYEDGAGNKVHSAYERQSATVLGGYKIDNNTRIDLDAVASRGEAAYADRTMDGSKFDRESYGFAFEKRNVSERVKRVNFRVYHSYIDHVMDNYSLRTLVGSPSAMNPDRTTDGARFSVDLALSKNNLITLGADWRQDLHTGRNGTSYATLARKNDYESRFAGVFGEWVHDLGSDRRLVSGLRFDSWAADRWYLSMMNAHTYYGDASETMKSGFVRLEQGLDQGRKAYIGFGVTQRPMDYWEASKGGIAPSDLVTLKPEQTAQLDVGLLWKDGKTTGAVSGFVAKVSDYILISTQTSGSYQGVNCTANMPCGTSSNVDATRLGFEGDIRHRLAGGWSVWGSAAYVYAQNDTMNVPLAQTPPLEIKLGSDYTAGNWTMGGVLRMVARQDRIHYNYGNVVGLDRAVATPGFATVGLNGSYKPSKSSQISFGIDNLFDRNYYEHISKSDVNQSSIGYSSYDVNTAINEPGRTFWVKGQVSF